MREAAGDRYADLEINMLQFAGIVTDDRKGTAEMMAPLFGLPPEELETYPHACIGTVERDLRVARDAPRAMGRVVLRVPGRHDGAAGSRRRQAPRHLSAPVGPVTAATTAWMDRWWDDDAGLLWNPPGSFEGVVEPRSVHLVRETAWYAIGLLRRDGAGDRARAEAALATVLDHQYDEPGQPWHGTFVRFPEWPPPTDGAIEWIDYDPNWRQFLGTALAVAITDFDLSPDARGAGPRRHPPGRRRPSRRIGCRRPTPTSPCCAPGSTAWAGRADDGYAARRSSTPSAGTAASPSTGRPPTTASTCSRSGSGSGPMRPTRCDATARELEAALWTDIARWWHAGLGNLCGPYSRAYGMDLGSYVSGLSLALWCAGLPAPMPSLDADVVPHGHDVCVAPMLEHVGVRVPADGAARLRALPRRSRGRAR